MFLTRRRDFILGSSALFLVGAGGRSLAAEMTPHEKDLYEAAKKEGELTWYTAHSDDITAQDIGRTFEALYPGLKLNVLRTTAQVAYQRVTQEIKASAIQCDVFSSTDIGHSVELKARGSFEKFVPENAAKVLDIYKNYDPDGYYYVTSAGLIGIGYNTTKVKEADAPKNWTDLLDPKWVDSIALGHPGFSGYVGTWALTLRNKYGWEFFEKLHGNQARIGKGSGQVVDDTASGELVASLAVDYITFDKISRGAPMALFYPPEMLIAPSPVAIMKNSPNLNAAKLFVDYLLSKEAQILIADEGTLSVHPEVHNKPEHKLPKVEDALKRAIKINYLDIMDSKEATVKKFTEIMTK